MKEQGPLNTPKNHFLIKTNMSRVFWYRMALGEGVFHKDFIYKMAFNIAHGPLGAFPC